MTVSRQQSPTEITRVQTDTGRFALVPEWVLDLDLSDKALRLYALLSVRWADRETGSCWPSRKTIADALRCSTDTVSRATAELEAAGALTVERRRGEDGTNHPNVYTVHRVRGSRMDATTPDRMDATTPSRKFAATWPHGCDPNQNQEQESLELENNMSPLAEATTPERERAVKLCEYFIEQLLTADPTAKRPTITKAWIDEADRMVRLDNRKRADIAAVIDWVFTNPAGSWWIPNIRSVPKLRKQFETLHGQMLQRSGPRVERPTLVQRDEIQTGRIEINPIGGER